MTHAYRFAAGALALTAALALAGCGSWGWGNDPDDPAALPPAPVYDEGQFDRIHRAEQVRRDAVATAGPWAAKDGAGRRIAVLLPAAGASPRLRDSLHGVLARLQAGQVLLASVGAVSPFVGLFGTVWGVFHAMQAISQSGSAALDQVAGPVGEALIMTAAGLAVAIPAVLAYNLFGKRIAQIEADLEGFALDLRDTLLSRAD